MNELFVAAIATSHTFFVFCVIQATLVFACALTSSVTSNKPSHVNQSLCSTTTQTLGNVLLLSQIAICTRFRCSHE